MKLNKTKTIFLIWILHFYLFYGLTTLYQHYEAETLHARFSDLISTIEFILFIPIVSLLLGVYYPVFLAIIVMILLIRYKNYTIFKSYLISLVLFFICYLIIFIQNNFIQYDFEWVVTLISLLITISIIKLCFRKTIKRLDEESNLS